LNPFGLKTQKAAARELRKKPQPLEKREAARLKNVAPGGGFFPGLLN